jgi:hypothetical protein
MLCFCAQRNAQKTRIVFLYESILLFTESVCIKNNTGGKKNASKIQISALLDRGWDLLSNISFLLCSCLEADPALYTCPLPFFSPLSFPVMLTLRPQPPPTRFPDRKMYQRRGRSRQVSHAALARQASEERRTPVPPRHALATSERQEENTELLPANKSQHREFTPRSKCIITSLKKTPVPIRATPPPEPPLPSPSPPASASMTPDSPPTPPRSLEDQVHIAYALDDIHLAKVLLLKLKGIEVTSDEDPRIAAVQDEDFDMCFFPHGKLMDDADEKALFEQQRKEREKAEERMREDRLRACERIWEQEKRRLREARALALKRKQAEEKEAEARVAEEEKRIRLAKEKEAERRARHVIPPPRNIVSYQALGRLRASSSTSSDGPFVYPFMIPTARPTRKVKSSQPFPQPVSQPYTRPTYDESRSVPFSDVLASMQGPLFPDEQRAPLPSQSRDERKNELLDSLLKVVEWEVDERRKLKGKYRAPQRKGSDKSCVACSIASPSVSSSLQSSSRSSWLSFSSAPSSSASTAVTTPSTSPPRSSWFSKPMVASPPPISALQQRPTSLIFSSLPTPPHSCNPRARFTPIPPAESPLYIPNSHATLSRISATSGEPSLGTEHAVIPSSDRVMRRVSRIVEIAKEFQNAYVNATLLAVMASSDNYEERTITIGSSVASFPGRHEVSLPSWRKLKPTGYRARSADVAVFLNTSRHRSNQEWSVSASFIPLKVWHPTLDPPRTILPDPLPYPIVFKPLPKPCRSPFRLHAHFIVPQRRSSSRPVPWASHLSNAPMAGDTNELVMWRMRTVENPMYLRLKALQNVLWEDGVNWQGRATEGSMGAGREKVMKVAIEGIGQSCLGIGSEARACW